MEEQKALSLKDFITNTLVDINGAVIDAMEAGVSIAHRKYNNGFFPKVKTVEFDVGVQVTNNTEVSKEGKAGLGISVMSLNLGRDKNQMKQEETINRIKFSVDLFLGQNLNSDADLEENK